MENEQKQDQQNQGQQKQDRQPEQQKNTEEPVWKDRKHFMWFPFSFTKYSVRKGRLFIDRGFFNTVQDQTLLYRIVDIQMRRSLAQRIFGTGTVVLVTKADINKEILLENIKCPQQVNDMLSDMIEEMRRQRNVVGREFYGNDPGRPPMPGDLDGGMGAGPDFDDFDDMPHPPIDG